MSNREQRRSEAQESRFGFTGGLADAERSIGSAWDFLYETTQTYARIQPRDGDGPPSNDGPSAYERMFGLDNFRTTDGAPSTTTDADVFVAALARRSGLRHTGRDAEAINERRIRSRFRTITPGPGEPGYRDPDDPLNSMIDVPPGFRPIRQARVRPGGFTTADAQQQRSQPQEVNPVYNQRDPREQLKHIPPESLRRVQERMIRAGFNVDVGGTLDPDTIAAMTKVMAFANNNGLNWMESLSDLERMNSEAQDNAKASARSDWARIQREMTRDTYLAPSYETLAESTKELFRQRLGRDPQDYEIELLSEELSASHAAAFNQEQDIQRQAALRQAALSINSQFEEGDEPIGVPGMAADGVAVDPIANFRTKFDELYKPEIDTAKAEVDHQNTTARLMSSFGSLNQRMMG